MVLCYVSSVLPLELEKFVGKKLNIKRKSEEYVKILHKFWRYPQKNNAYKQEQTPHYYVHDVADMRSQIEKCGLIYVSSAPSAETWKKSNEGKWKIIFLKTEKGWN